MDYRHPHPAIPFRSSHSFSSRRAVRRSPLSARCNRASSGARSTSKPPGNRSHAVAQSSACGAQRIRKTRSAPGHCRQNRPAATRRHHGHTAVPCAGQYNIMRAETGDNPPVLPRTKRRCIAADIDAAPESHSAQLTVQSLKPPAQLARPLPAEISAVLRPWAEPGAGPLPSRYLQDVPAPR